MDPALPAHTRRFRLLLALPKLGIVLLLIAVIALLWLLHRNKVEEDRASLIKDVLWLEQHARFYLDSNEEQLRQLASDLGSGLAAPAAFRVRAQHLIKTNPDIAGILWLDQHGRIVQSLPPGTVTSLPSQPAVQRALEMASRQGKRIYAEPFITGDGASQFALITPFGHDGLPGHSLVTLYAMQPMLNTLVPWWFAEKYRVVIVDENEVEYAAKSKIEGQPDSGYELAFDPPGYGLKLRVTAYQIASNPLQHILAAAILILAAGVFWSIWLLRDQMKRRLSAEDALKAEHAFRKSMEDSLTVGMRARDLEGRVIYVNQAFCKMTGFAREELVDRNPPMPYWVPEQIDETFALHQAVLAGEAPADGFEITFMRKNGERFQALIYEAKLIDGRGQHTGWMASILDITERKRAEELARQQQEQLQFTARLVTMGEMASTLAHELNQPLAAIASYNTGCLNLLASGRCDPDELRPALEKLGVQAQRAGKIIRRVHDFVRKSEPRRQPCQIGEIIEDCVGFVEAEARKHQIRLATRLPALLPLIHADRLMLEQVLLNLIRNGMEAMRDTPASERQLLIHAECQTEDLLIQVIDRGCGIPPEIRDKLFTAFFTTKANGMGIGLSICRSIVEFHRGRLWAEDNPDGPGTVFHLTLPLEAK